MYATPATGATTVAVRLAEAPSRAEPFGSRVTALLGWLIATRTLVEPLAPASSVAVRVTRSRPAADGVYVKVAPVPVATTLPAPLLNTLQVRVCVSAVPGVI